MCPGLDPSGKTNKQANRQNRKWLLETICSWQKATRLGSIWCQSNQHGFPQLWPPWFSQSLILMVVRVRHTLDLWRLWSNLLKSSWYRTICRRSSWCGQKDLVWSVCENLTNVYNKTHQHLARELLKIYWLSVVGDVKYKNDCYQHQHQHHNI